MSPYAEGTTVEVAKSVEEIRRLLMKNGATHYAYGSGPDGEVVQFAIDGHFYRFGVTVPTPGDLKDAYIGEPTDWQRAAMARRINWTVRAEAEHRRRWRARLIWLKSLLEFTDDVPLGQSMLANLVLPDGRTFGGWAGPQIEAMYEGGKMPPLLGAGT